MFYLKNNVRKHNIVYSAFGGQYKGFGLVSFAKLGDSLIGKCLVAPNDTIHEKRCKQAWETSYKKRT
jgi:hypothetical protein